jgi:alcohol dehydrogenase class IV
MNIAAVEKANPLVQASRLHAFELARTSLPYVSNLEDAQSRLNLCAAALLQNRDEDDGGRPFDVHWVASSVYALGAAMFNRVRHLDQGVTHAILTPAAIREFYDLCPIAVQAIGKSLGLDVRQASDPDRVSVHFKQYFGRFGVTQSLGEQGVTQEDLLVVLENSLHNFNANRAGGLVLHRDRLMNILTQSL